MIRRWLCYGLLLAAPACARSEIESCEGGAASVAFRRDADLSIGCGHEGAGMVVLRSAGDWRERCAVDSPPVDVADWSVIGLFLEDECRYSGCMDSVPLIQQLERRGCRLEVVARDIEIGELGFCHACVQPRDVVLVASEDLDGLVELR